MTDILFRGVCLVLLFSSCSDNLPVFNDDDSTADHRVIVGYVHDNAEGIPNVVVSDGFITTVTDENGRYNLPIDKSAEFVFISIPTGYKIPAPEGIALFYKKVTTAEQGQMINFELHRNEADDLMHAFVVWADPQIKTYTHGNFLKTESATDVSNHLHTLGNIPVHGISVGDLVSEKFDLYPCYTEAVMITGIPFFQVVGNHDLDYEAPSQEQAEIHFTKNFGPTYYSFNRGKVHYIILNNIKINFNGATIEADNKYSGYFFQNQLEWLREDLKHVRYGSTVVVALHIPCNGLPQSSNIRELYEILEGYSVHIISGHKHANRNFPGGSISEHNQGTLCGAWWSCDICTDGTPNGYGIYLVDGDSIRWYYKATGYDPLYQFRLYSLGSSQTYPDDIIVNVWNWDSLWTVEWYEDGIRIGSMSQFSGYDPMAYERFFGPEIPEKMPSLEPRLTHHLFSANPTGNVRNITVKVTDPFKNEYVQSIDMEK